MEELEEGGLVPGGEVLGISEPALGRVGPESTGDDPEEAEKGGEAEEETVHRKTVEGDSCASRGPAESEPAGSLSLAPDPFRG